MPRAWFLTTVHAMPCHACWYVPWLARALHKIDRSMRVPVPFCAALHLKSRQPAGGLYGELGHSEL